LTGGSGPLLRAGGDDNDEDAGLVCRAGFLGLTSFAGRGGVVKEAALSVFVSALVLATVAPATTTAADSAGVVGMISPFSDGGGE
jgi:hypothetical protein